MAEYEILRILVTGSFSSGKTTFIRQISEQTVVSVERANDRSSIAFDWGPLTIDSKTFVYFFGAPAARNPYRDPILTDLPRWGAILMVDMSSLSSFFQSTTKEVKGHLTEIHKLNMPCVIALNRHDTEGALTEPEVRDAIEATSSEIIVNCNANSRAEVRDAVIKLVEQFPDDEVIRKTRAKLQSLADK
jgi:uncharacterized protein